MYLSAPNQVINPYLAPSFKHHFVEKFNVLVKSKAGQEVNITTLLAEAFAVFLEIVGDDVNEEEKIKQTIITS